LVKLFIIRAICVRCGRINDYSLGLTNKSDDAVYTCENCNFNVIVSWMEEKDE
jgi:DNA-directed RNA polymerase subunit RPC12/RpoP